MEQANAAATLLEHWVQNMEANAYEEPLATGEVSILLGVSLNVVCNWERNGLATVPRNPYNSYRCESSAC